MTTSRPAEQITNRLGMGATNNDADTRLFQDLQVNSCREWIAKSVEDGFLTKRDVAFIDRDSVELKDPPGLKYYPVRFISPFASLHI